MDSSIYRLRTADVLVLCVLCLLGLGVIMVQSAATGTAGWDWSLAGPGSRQLIFAALGLVAFLAVGAIHYDFWQPKTDQWWKNPILWLVLIAIFCNVVVLIPHVGKSINGARRWLPLGPLQFEPSELAKWAVVLFLANGLTRKPEKWDSFFGGFLPMLIPVAILCVLVVIQDFGTATLIALCALAMLLAGRVRLRHLIFTVPPVGAAGFWLLAHTAYRWRRITAFLNPYAAPEKEGYHMIQSLLTFASGGFTGRGLGNGIQKLGYLPEDTTDFIFSIICEELGFFGALLTASFFLGIIYVTWQTLRARIDDFGRMLAFGVGTMVGLQALINIAVATVSVPTKGLSLPLVSAGGSGLVITGAALGLLLSVCRRETDNVNQPASQEAPSVLQNALQASVANTPANG